ncbi:hypothetical protein LI170_16070, partial [Desulfovibrio desulfuricans]
VLKYVSIKIPALTHSGRKSRVCVNQPDRLTPNTRPCFCLFSLCLYAFQFSPHQKLVVGSPSLNSPERMRSRWLVLGEFAKYAFCGLKRKRRDFERSVL